MLLQQYHLKPSVRRQYFFCNEDWRWAYLDTFLVLMAVQDQVILYMDTGDKGANLNFMRSLQATTTNTTKQYYIYIYIYIYTYAYV